jgi:serine/threonine protein kinase
VSEDYPAQLSGLRPGSLVAGYRLQAQVGEGGMAVVYRARDERLGRLVALKLLGPAMAMDPAFRRRFIAESRAAAAVDHPHIIPVYEAGEVGGLLFIAMRFVQGGDLRGVLGREGPLAPGRATGFLSPVASALDAAHRAGLVHRDVKPGNVLVEALPDGTDHAYLSDFGVSKGAITSVSLTGPGHFIGTPDYSAPEQIEGRDVDGRTDQYALACVAYQLLTGHVPFKRGQGMAAVLYAHLSDPPPPLDAGLPRAADEVLATALAKAPEKRYGSCREFADALREALGVPPYRSFGPVPPRPPSPLVAQPAIPGLTPALTAGSARYATGPVSSMTPAVTGGGIPAGGLTEDPARSLPVSHPGRPPARHPRSPRYPDPGDHVRDRSRSPRPRRTRRLALAAAVAAAAAVVAVATLLLEGGHPNPGSGSASGPTTAGNAASASGTPVISNVSFSGTSGSYTLTVTGSGFGPASANTPFTGTAPNFRIADSAQVGHGEWGYVGDANQLTYQSWTNSRVVVSGLGASPGDALVLALWNSATGGGVTWGGDVPGGPGSDLAIRSVVFSGPPSDPEVTIHGSGFGAPAGSVPFTGTFQNFAFGDWRAYHAGQGPASTWTSGVTEDFTSWTNTTIVISGFAGTFGTSPNILSVGDPVSIQIWSPAASYDTGPQTAWGGRYERTGATPATSGTTPETTGTTAPATGGASSPTVIRQDTTLSSDIFCSDLTIEPGVTLNTNGHNIYCSGTVDNEGTIVTGPSASQDFPLSYGGSGGGSTDLGGAAAAGFSTRSSGGTACSASGCTAGNGSSPAFPGLTPGLVRSWYQAGMNQYLAGAGGGSSPVAHGGAGANGLFIEASRIIAGTIDCAGGAGQNQPAQSSAGGGGGGVVILAYLSSLTPGNYEFSGGYTITADGTHHEFGGNGAVVTRQFSSLPIPASR